MRVGVIERVNATIDHAWPVFSDFSGLAGLIKGASVDVEGLGAGAVRTITNPDGSKIQERLESVDLARHSFTYAVINDDAPVPFTGYLATVILRKIDGHQCEIEWSSEFTPNEEVSANNIAPILERAYRAAIRHLSDKLAKASG